MTGEMTFYEYIKLNNAKYLILPIACMAIIAGLSSIPGDPRHIPKTFDFMLWVPPNIQNLLHIPLYAGFAWIWCRNLQRMALPVRQSTIIAFALSMLFGIIDEWHQTFVAGRYGTALDVLFNFVGIILGVAICKIQTRNAPVPNNSGS